VNTESEIKMWRAAWKEAPTETVEAYDFHSEHNRQQRWLRVRHIFGLVFAALLIGYAAYVLHNDFRAEVLAWAVVVWITTLLVTAFSVWNWRGLWSASALSVQEYVDAYERRNLAMLRAIRFGYWFLALQLSITVPWLTIDFLRHQTSVRQYAMSMGFLCVFSAAFVAWFRHSRLKASRELKQVEVFRQDCKLPEG
jgi:hypothetical protein